MKVTTKEEFAKAVERGDEEIEVVGAYASTVCGIAKIKPISWAMILSGLAVSIGMAPLSGGLSLGVMASMVPIGSLCSGLSVGVATALSALLAIGGVSLLRKLRDYKVVSRNGNNRVILRKKV